MINKSGLKTNINVNKLIESFLIKYESLISFLPLTEIELMFQNAIQLSHETDINPDFQINFLAEKMFFLKARDEINSGNIDLEILIVDKYLSLAKFMLRQLKYKGDDADKIAEEAIIDCIESYEGKDGFKNAILKSIKKILNPPQKEETIVIPQFENEENKEIKYQQSEFLTELSEETFTAIENKTKLIVPNDDIARNPNQLDLLIKGIDILHQVPLDDEIYLKFIYLKYGYCNNQYFGLDEICGYLNISLETARKYYFQSLDYIKNWFSLQLDKMYQYYIQN